MFVCFLIAQDESGIFDWEKNPVSGSNSLDSNIVSQTKLCINNQWHRNTGPKFKCIIPAKNKKVHAHHCCNLKLELFVTMATLI